MEHIEEAGIHSGDSACSLPPFSLPRAIMEAIKEQSRALARELDVRGLMNVQFAVPRDGSGIFILEVNPRASRTVPFVSKVIGIPLAKVAARIAAGKTLREMGIKRSRAQAHRGQRGGVPVREVRRRGHSARPRDALHRRGHGHRSQLRGRLRQEPARGGMRLPVPAGKPMTAFMSVKNSDKDLAIPVART
jgi:carbamoyl-phosphate synthase large subunit